MTLAARPWRELPTLLSKTGTSAWALAVLFLFLLGTWLYRIIPEWSSNPDLSHGFFAPILFGLLLQESRQRGPRRFLPANAVNLGVCGGLVALSLVTLLTACLFAAGLDWSHSMVEFLLGCSVSGAVAALMLYFSLQPYRLIPFNWVAVVALLMWVLSLPIPPGTYSSLTLGLQLWVTERVLGALHILGIPAIRNGNLIELATTTVGVEEACSGVRSLLSCIFAGFFFSAAFVRHWGGRLLLLVLAPLLAIVMNFVRSLTLTLLANKGVDISGMWHDATGFAILGVTALLLAGLALLLEKFESTTASTPATDAAAPGVSNQPLPRNIRRGSRILATGFGLATGCVVFFFFMTRPAPPGNDAVPDVLALMPANPPGWRIATSGDLYQFADILETEHLGQRIYLRNDPQGNLIQITVYIAYWSPGQTAVSTVASHTPDACWPGNGWDPVQTDFTTVNLPLAQRELHRAEYRIFDNKRLSQHVWFWHSYDRRVIREFNPRRPLDLLASVMEFGVRSQGEQMFVRLTSNRPWADIAQEPLVEEIFDRLQPYGI
ncbi:exosortase/archaeosortase family protein [Synoicihabitans lomoniglobus]|uniref:Exosortase/archaeosortase family protein n=1 Tax=Synoicihabitans lomoniglobus TaxID=2909285 RepID=A0AAF0CSC9_9BACT|nr:exosortase-associated EpsI family protein [Opitutaceae bacterium LMO-M01]WED67150.1 exosortase/archaeosortase family protein [Opitutaceae bacterium LMO-M01]